MTGQKASRAIAKEKTRAERINPERVGVVTEPVGSEAGIVTTLL